jgi:DNA-binding IclR family transcriptional regulator
MSAPTRAQRNLTADRTIQLLLLYEEGRPVLSASEVANKLGMSRSTTYRYLQSLRDAGLLEEESAGYRLGPRIFQLARIARQGLGLSEVAAPVMRRLVDATGETILLTRRSGNRVVCLEREESWRSLRLSYERGQVLPVHAGASALVTLAWLDEDELERAVGSEPLERFTDNTITDPRALRARLGEIRRNGYIVTYGERDQGVVGIAAPIFGRRDHVIAGLTIVTPQHRLDAARLDDTVRLVKAAAEEIAATIRTIDG